MKIKNWTKFQHFKDRKPPWIKLYRDLLDDLNWHELDPVAAKSLVALWLIASEYDGALPDIKTLSFRLRLPEKSVKSIVSKLAPWLEQVDISAISDSNLISERYHGDINVKALTRSRETETETETEVEVETYKQEAETDTQTLAPQGDANPLNAATWKAYKGAYLQRYGVDPVRNATVNSQIVQFVKRLGVESPDVAAFYVRSNAAFYVRGKHGAGLMVKDAEGLRTEWATGRTVTNAEAQMMDETAARGNVWSRVAEKMEAKERVIHEQID